VYERSATDEEDAQRAEGIIRKKKQSCGNCQNGDSLGQETSKLASEPSESSTVRERSRERGKGFNDMQQAGRPE